MDKEKIYVIADLICKSWKGILNPMEKEKLDRLLEDPRWLQLKMNLENDQFMMDRFLRYDKYNETTDFSLFLSMAKKRRKAKSYKSQFLWGGVAAAFLCVIGVYLLYYSRVGDEKEYVSQNMFSEVTNSSGIRLIISGEQMIDVSEKQGVNVLDSIGGCLMVQSKTLDYLNVSRVDPGIQELQYHTLLVPRGMVYKLVLSDSTRVVLNAETRIRYPVCFGKDKREVNVDGEAYFEVAKNPDAPFIVTGKNYKLEVLGTSFNVRSYDDESATDVTLLTGSVKMNLQDTLFYLKPGEQASIFGENRYDVHRADISSVISWLENKFSFSDEKLEVILKKIARWYGVEVFYEESALRERCYTGKMPNDVPLPELLEMLNHTTDIKYILRGGVIFVNNNRD